MSDSYEDYQPEPGGYGQSNYGGHPGIATSLCAFLLVASCAGNMQRTAPVAHSSAELIGYIFGGSLLGALLWAIAYGITIRKASPGWKAGSLVVLLILGLIGSLSHVLAGGMGRVADRQDAVRTMDQLLAEGGAKGPITPGPDAGPMTRLLATAVNGRLADAKAFNDEAAADGLNTIISSTGLTKSTPALDHCDRFTTLADHATANAGRMPQILAELRKTGDEAVARGEIGQDELEGFLEGVAGAQGNYKTSWMLNAQVAEDAGKLCAILARRHWQIGSDGRILFDNHADLAAAQPILSRISDTGAQLRQARTDARRSVTSDLDKIR